MPLQVRNVILDVDDLETAEAFWTEALGYTRAMGEDGIWCALVDPHRKNLPVGLQSREDAKDPGATNRVHLDLMAEDVEAEVERLTELGARRVGDWPYPPDATFVVMQDPCGNEFCVTQNVEL